jgi:hypothetical protein
MKRSAPACAKIARVEKLTPEFKRQLIVSGAILVASTLLLTSAVRAEGDDQKALDKRLAQQRADAEMKNADTSRMTADQLAAYKTKVAQAKDKAQKQADLAEFKEKSMNNLADIKAMFQKAEEAFKVGKTDQTQYAIASPLYNSVAMATVPGSEQMAETSRSKLIELEQLAQKALHDAEDADMKQDYVNEVQLLAGIVKDFYQTKTKANALNRLVSLKSRPDVAGYVELAQAESLEADGKMTEAVALYSSIAGNPRYENSVPQLKASKKVEELGKNEEVAAKIKADTNAKADKEAPVLLGAAKNYVANNRPKQAIEKLQLILEKYPDTRYAEDARKQLEELKAVVSTEK